jgi:hypothetical protein
MVTSQSKRRVTETIRRPTSAYPRKIHHEELCMQLQYGNDYGHVDFLKAETVANSLIQIALFDNDTTLMATTN